MTYIKMNAFIIHSTRDKEEVLKIIEGITEKTNGFNALLLNNGGVFWKVSASRKIRNSQVVVFFVGKSSHTSKYIGWELNEAIKYNKQIIIIKLKKEYVLHNALNLKDDYSKLSKIYGKVKTVEELVEIVNNHVNGEYLLFNECCSEENKHLLLEQYKLFLETSENLVQRRQNVNNFYISANTLLATLSGTVIAFDLETRYKMILGIVFSFVGVILAFSWMNLLTSYGNLNSSKMKIISLIEKKLPASLFDTEWEVLSDTLNNKRYVSFTSGEKQIPKMFLVIYFLVIIITIAISFTI